MKNTETDKWIGHNSNWYEAINKIMIVERDYANHIFDIRDDVTRRQACEEFWNRVSESYGFKIDFQRESK